MPFYSQPRKAPVQRWPFLILCSPQYSCGIQFALRVSIVQGTLLNSPLLLPVFTCWRWKREVKRWLLHYAYAPAGFRVGVGELIMTISITSMSLMAIWDTQTLISLTSHTLRRVWLARLDLNSLTGEWAHESVTNELYEALVTNLCAQSL